jgi:hypothetical protein
VTEKICSISSKLVITAIFILYNGSYYVRETPVFDNTKKFNCPSLTVTCLVVPQVTNFLKNHIVYSYTTQSQHFYLNWQFILDMYFIHR